MISPSLLVRMTRPGFLSLTAAACVLGFATGGPPDELLAARAAAALVLALVLHAAANVLNDYEDARSGADDANTSGIFPFTGGSRLIQEGVVSMDQTRALGLTMLGAAAAGGLLLVWIAGPTLLVLGMAGVFLAWSYSSPPLQLMSRGLGEPAVGAAWGLVVLGAAHAGHAHIAGASLAIAPAFALLAANILLVNELPDARADAMVGKRTLVVALGARRAARVSIALAVLAQAGPVAAVLWANAPRGLLGSLSSAPLALAASVLVARHAGDPARLRTAIQLTIAATLTFAVGASIGCALLPR